MQTNLISGRVRFSLPQFKPRCGLRIFSFVGFLLASYGAWATVTPVAYWRMGENDPGAGNGVAATNVADLAGSHPLVFHGTAAYSADVSAFATYSTNSSLSVNFTNSAYATNSVVSTAVDNFGIECWVKPTTSGTSEVIAYTGRTGGSGSGGWGLIIAGNNTYQALFGGVLAFGTNAATPNVWTHLALVRASGTSTLYVNGVATVTNTAAPGVPGGNFAVGAPPQSPTSQFFTGLVDEVRVFTFAPGQFSTNDLLFQHPSLVVTNLADSGAGSLRTALGFALSGDLITFATNGVISLASELAVSNNVEIRGPGATNLTVSGTLGYRVFNIAANSAVKISGLAIRNGQAGPGGGIYNAGSLSVSNCTIADNMSELLFSGSVLLADAGGGVYNVGSLSLNSCTLYNNRAGDGATSFTGNGSPGYNGGAIYNVGSATLSQCTVYNNSAGNGGMGAFNIPNGYAGGDGGSGGGIVNAGAGTLQLIACTVAMNNSGIGGPGGAGFQGSGPTGAAGANGGVLQAGSQASFINTIVGSNSGSSAPDVSGAFTSLGHNVIGNISGATGITNGIKGDLVADPALGPFGFYGGANQMQVLSLLPGSPALNAGDDAVLAVPYLLTTDERGLPRKVGAHVDIGAYENAFTFSNAVVTTLPAATSEDPTLGYWLATLPGTVNPGGYPSAVYFEYGTTLGYGQRVPVGTYAFLNFSNNPVSTIISNLVISQIYHYRVVATNAAGVFAGNDQMFTIVPPIVADLNGDGVVDPSELATVLSHLGTNRVSLSNVNQVLLNYLSGDALLMTNVAGLGSSNVTFGLSNSPAVNFTVQSSTNLTDWQTVGSAQLFYRFTDTNTPLPPSRQYRLVYP